MEESLAGLSQNTGLEKAHPSLDGLELPTSLHVCRDAVNGVHPLQIVHS